ncbi:hypothetical protein ST47_g4770 [Ascochyta rabiei]|uniref:Uncharacterized protein n=1 Tax=Didymella rabiei TaxID=5454 RepID=A0A163F193_DIDRA|nr:hypothetical protein ST47_g4770 [Ascochyta rabiei]
MPSNATLVSPDASCWLCSYAKRIGRSACVACQSASRPTKHLPKPVNTKPQYHRRHVRASALYELAEASSRNEGAPHITLDSLLKTVQSEKMVPMETDAPGVMLAHGDFGKVPAIWLEPADGSAPTMDLITWTTLETPIWEGDEVCLYNPARGSRKYVSSWKSKMIEYLQHGMTIEKYRQHIAKAIKAKYNA